MERENGPFEVLRTSVESLTTDPGQPVLVPPEPRGDGRLKAAQVVDLLRHAPQEVADPLWHRVFALSRAGEAAWTVLAVGAVLPRMVVACSRYARVPTAHRADVEAEMITAVLELVRSLPAGVGGVGERLWSAASGTANRWGYLHARDARRHVTVPASLSLGVVDAGGRGPVSVLADAVASGVLSPAEAELIARTRLERTALMQVAQEMGLSYITARRWRKAAEDRLVPALRSGDFSGPMSDFGS
ncbi:MULTISPECIES: hypothetical protein [unclassified Nocardiopsis]|uniref:hypothetical protein n=1 Tax=Nocardiopsis TaxID=2013 RepID=UPI00387AB99E